MSDDPFDLEWASLERNDGSEQRFVDAALRLLEASDSYDDLAVAAIAKEAGRSVGAFYARFPDKRALLHRLQETLYREGTETMERALAAAATAFPSLDALVRGFVELAVSIYAVQRGLRRAILLEMARDHAMRARAIALSAATVDGLTQVIAPHFPAAAREIVQRTADVLHRIVIAVLDQRLLFGGDSPTGHDLDDRGLADQLTIAAVAYARMMLPAGGGP